MKKFICLFIIFFSLENIKLNQNIETIFLMSDVENQIISSRFVKEIVKLKGDIKKFTTKSTIKSLKEKYE